MFYKKILFILILPFFWVGFSYAEEITLPNTGFIKSGIWYSKDPFFTGDKIRIYTIVFNGSEHELLGDIEFKDNDKLICRGSVAVISGRTQEIWCDWTAIAGEHKITANITNSKVSVIGESPRTIVLENNITGVSERIVKSAPIQKVEEKKILTIDIETTKENTASTSSAEKSIQSGLEAVQKNISNIAPSEIKKEDLITTTDKILSYIPASIKEKVGKIAESTGLVKIKTPLSYFVDFFVAVYKFIINDALVIVIILFFILREILKAIYNKITKMY